MNEPEQRSDRSLVRITHTERGDGWQVSVRVGDTEAELEEALRLARRIAGELSQGEGAPDS